MEDELREAVQGPDTSWLEDPRADTEIVHGASTSDDPDAQAQLKLLEGAGQRLAGAHQRGQ